MMGIFEDTARRILTFVTSEVAKTNSVEWLCRMRGQCEAIATMGNSFGCMNSALMLNLYYMMDDIDQKLEKVKGE